MALRFFLRPGNGGLPIYIRPKFFVDQYEISLVALGLALLILRSIDFSKTLFWVVYCITQQNGSIPYGLRLSPCVLE